MKNDLQRLRGLKTFSYKHSQSRARTNPLTKVLREAGRFMRATSCIAAIALLNAIFFPYYTVAQEATEVAEAKREAAERIVLEGSSEERLNQALLKVQEIAHSKCDTISGRLAEEKSVLSKALNTIGLAKSQLEEVGQLKQLCDLLEGLDKTAIAQFQQTEEQLRAKGLPEEILQRHFDMVAHYQEQFAELSTCLTEVLESDSLEDQGAAMDALDQLMAPQKLKKRHQTVDPNNLPWGTPDASKVREPARTPEELSQQTGISPFPQGILLAANTLPPNIFDLAGGPVAEDLAETPDIKITDAIRDLAENQLGDDPVAIYNWVRNNIEFIPSYGSIQGADYTLQHGKGNAFDTASLLIALYRASNIPARYAYGTVRIPVDEVMNWVGGVEVPEAAQQLLGQGGIPNRGLIQGGKITHIEMEHVWVEAWVDYFPSRGAKHDVGDQWIPLDASFKQYDFIEGLDFESNVTLDGDGLVTNVIENSISDDSSISSFPGEFVGQEFANLTLQLEEYIASQGEDLLAKEVLGGKTVIEVDYEQLSAGLPYQLIVRTNNFSVIPDDLRHKIRFTLQNASNSFFGFDSFNDVFVREFSLPELAGKLLSLSFTPEDSVANEVLLSFIPETEITSTNVPTDIPGYLLSLKAQLTLDGEVIAEGGSLTMGSETNNNMRIYSPSFGWKSSDASGIAGEYRAIGIDIGGYSQEQLEDIQLKTEELRQFFENGVLDESFDKHLLMGLLAQSNIVNYFAMNDYMNEIHSRQQGIVEYRLPSYGYFLTSLTPSYFFGIPRQVKTSGVTMDVPFLQTMSSSVDNNSERWVDYNRSKGFRASYLENFVPELLLSTNESDLEGVSAAKLLNEALSQGQTVYTLTSANLDLLAAVEIDLNTRQDILNALNAGKEVTIHERSIAIQGWRGFGYLVIDPSTGAGGYLISGGANGGSIANDLLGFVGWLLGMVDGAYGHLSVDSFGRAIFSERLKSIQRALKASAVLGYIALGLSIFLAFENGFTWDAVGTASISILAFVITLKVVTLIALATGPILGAILGGLAVIAITALANRLTGALFGLHVRSTKYLYS